jgi:hypothetical protein
MTIDPTEILQHALVGYQIQRANIDKRIEDLQRRLNGAAAQDQEKPKRKLSARGRAAIVRATKERWRRARAAGRKRSG